MPVVQLPTIKVNADALVKPRAVKDGDLAHVRFQYRSGEPGRYLLVPRAIASQWVEVGVREKPRSVTEGMERPDQSRIGPMAHVRVRFGLQETKNFLVPTAMAKKWEAHAERFERLLDEYQEMMNPDTGG